MPQPGTRTAVLAATGAATTALSMRTAAAANARRFIDRSLQARRRTTPPVSRRRDRRRTLSRVDRLAANVQWAAGRATSTTMDRGVTRYDAPGTGVPPRSTSMSAGDGSEVSMIRVQPTPSMPVPGSSNSSGSQ